MKHSRLTIFSFLICLVFIQKSNAQAVRHPGLRATCPICNGLALMQLMPNFATLPKSSQKAFIAKKFPSSNAEKMLKVLTSVEGKPLTNLPLDKDDSFRTFLVTFGDGSKTKFFTVTDKESGRYVSGNNFDFVMSKVMELSGENRSAYLLVEDIYSRRADNFFINVENYKVKEQVNKIKTMACDFTIDAGGNVRRLGTTFFENNAKFEKETFIERVTLKNGAVVYKSTVGISVKKSSFTLSFFSKTKKKLQDFMTNLRDFFIQNPGTSAAKAVNQSKIISDDEIIVQFSEASFSQIVKLEIKQIKKNYAVVLPELKKNSDKVFAICFQGELGYSINE